MQVTQSLAKFIYLVLTFIGFNFFVQEPSNSDISLWKVTSSAGGEIYFLNNIEENRTNQIYQDLLDKTEVLVFEMDFEAFEQSYSELIQNKGLSSEGEDIKNDLSPEIYQKLEEQSTALGLPLEAVKNLRPWFIAVVLQAHEIQNSIDTSFTTNEQLFYETKKTNNEIKYLETAEFQINLFADMSKEKQLTYLTYILNHPSYFQKLNEIILVKENQNLVDRELSNFPNALYQDLVAQRNKHWLPQIKKFIHQQESALVILNPGHLHGAEGLLTLLEKEGYQVEPQKI
ncbi:MAG TPA: TraB/GumN family protein [Flavobacteriaceae bacterium]|nr:TraB/GumN family protein [Flavobacteriaceae bacterium]